MLVQRTYFFSIRENLFPWTLLSNPSILHLCSGFSIKGATRTSFIYNYSNTNEQLLAPSIMFSDIKYCAESQTQSYQGNRTHEN